MMMKISLRLYPSIPEFLGVRLFSHQISGLSLHGILGISSYRPLFPFSLLSPSSSTFLFRSILGISVEAGSFATLHSCALKSIFELYDKLVDPPFLWSTQLQFTSLLSSCCFFLLTLWRNLHFLVLVGRGLFWWLWRTYNYISFVPSPIPSPYRVRLVDFFLLLFWPGVGLFNISKNKDVVGTSLVSRGQIRR